jgi:hypothetical protein
MCERDANERRAFVYLKLSTENTHAYTCTYVAAVLGTKSRRRSTLLFKGGYTLVTLPRIVTPYSDSVDGTRVRVTYQKLVTR